jgi:hypothetical protein
MILLISAETKMARFNVVALLFVAQPHFAEAAMVPMLFINQSAPSHSMSEIRTLSPGLKCPAGQLYRALKSFIATSRPQRAFRKPLITLAKASTMAAAGPLAQHAHAGIVLCVIPANPGRFPRLQRPARHARASHAVVEPMQVLLCFVF